MMELMLGFLWFDTTNGMPGGQILTTIKFSKSMTKLDASSMFEVFRSRLANEVISDITYGGQDIVDLDMCVDIFGDTSMNISINGRQKVPFVIPAFSDSLTSPVISNDISNCFGIAQDIEQICNSVSSLSTSMVAGYQAPSFGQGII